MVLEGRPLLKDGRPSSVALWGQGGGGFRMRREECNEFFLVPHPHQSQRMNSRQESSWSPCPAIGPWGKKFSRSEGAHV